MVTVEGRLPFDICKTAIETTRSDGRVRHRSVGQSLLQVDTPDTPPHVRLPLLPLVEAELSRIGVAYEVVGSIDDLAQEAPLAGAAEAPSASYLPQQSHEWKWQPKREPARQPKREFWQSEREPLGASKFSF